MKGLFDYEIKSPVYPVPLTPAQRAEKQAEKRRKRLHKAEQRQKEFRDKYDLKKLDLSQFHEEPETKSFFIGQNVYIKPSYLVSIPEYIYFNSETGEISKNPRLTTAAFIENQKNLLDNDQKGKLSRKAVTGLRNSINWLCIAAKKKQVYHKAKDMHFSFKVNFVTLTLPDTETPISSNDFQKKLLNPFLVYMRKYADLKNYVWRLEFQANGKLHVHLTTDSFLHLKQIRERWNVLLDSNGYMNDFYKKNGHRDPNSTDVHATKNIKNLAGYLSKYMSKKNSVYKIIKKRTRAALTPLNSKAWYKQRLNFWNSPFNPRPVTGRLWSCSKELSKANDCKVHIPEDECRDQMKCLMDKTIEYREITASPKKKPETGYSDPGIIEQGKKIGELFFIKARDWYGKITGIIKDTFNETRWLIRKAESNHVFELA